MNRIKITTSDFELYVEYFFTFLTIIYKIIEDSFKEVLSLVY